MDFSSMLETWIGVLTRPSDETFEAESAKPSATLTTGLIWIVVAGFVAAILGWLRSLIFVNSAAGMDTLLSQADLPPEVQAQMSQFMAGGAMAGMMGGASLFSIVLIPVFFLIGVGILHLVARVLGGQGEYGKYAYLMATFQAPISIISAVIGFIPLLGGCVAALLSIYSLVLSYFATKVNYGLTSGKAIIVVLVPILFALLLMGCVFFGVMGLVLSQ